MKTPEQGNRDDDHAASDTTQTNYVFTLEPGESASFRLSTKGILPLSHEPHDKYPDNSDTETSNPEV